MNVNQLNTYRVQMTQADVTTLFFILAMTRDELEADLFHLTEYAPEDVIQTAREHLAEFRRIEQKLVAGLSSPILEGS